MHFLRDLIRRYGKKSILSDAAEFPDPINVESPVPMSFYYGEVRGGDGAVLGGFLNSQLSCCGEGVRFSTTHLYNWAYTRRVASLWARRFTSPCEASSKWNKSNTTWISGNDRVRKSL